MKVVKCINGDFFDLDTYEVCPKCGAKPAAPGAAAPTRQTVQAAEKPKKKGLFGGWKKNHTQSPAANQFSQNNGAAQSYSNPPQAASGAAGSEWPQHPVNSVQSSNTFAPEEKTDALPINQPVQPAVPQTENNSIQPAPKAPAVHSVDHTIDFWQSNDEEEVNPGAPSVHSSGSTKKEVSQSPAVRSAFGDQADEETSSLSEAIRRASANSEGKTASYFSAVTSSSSNSGTSASDNTRKPSDPVVGWLVAISGPHFGESFPVSAGKNSIGRSTTNKIILDLDSAVSRDKHALIVYEPKKRNFFIQPGESSGLTYLNEDYITESKQLSERDIIETGSSKLLFIPLCGENFTWEDYINKE